MMKPATRITGVVCRINKLSDRSLYFVRCDPERVVYSFQAQDDKFNLYQRVKDVEVASEEHEAMWENAVSAYGIERKEWRLWRFNRTNLVEKPRYVRTKKQVWGQGDKKLVLLEFQRVEKGSVDPSGYSDELFEYSDETFDPDYGMDIDLIGSDDLFGG